MKYKTNISSVYISTRFYILRGTVVTLNFLFCLWTIKTICYFIQQSLRIKVTGKVNSIVSGRHLT